MSGGVSICRGSQRRNRRRHLVRSMRARLEESIGRLSRSPLYHWTLGRKAAIESQRLTGVVRGTVGEDPAYGIRDLSWWLLFQTGPAQFEIYSSPLRQATYRSQLIIR